MDFLLPAHLEAAMPPEARGLTRDQVRLMVSYAASQRIIHSRFRQIGDFLEAGDLLVINTSGTMNAALKVTREDGTPLELHLSTHLPADIWVVEVRKMLPQSSKVTQPFYDIEAGEVLRLPAGAQAVMQSGYPASLAQTGRQRLWLAQLRLPTSWQDYLLHYGFPIRYSYVKDEWPTEYYQTVYATEVGSAEMPSAGRAFTPELITQLVARGVRFAPLVLHTGVASLELDEHPYEEFYRVPAETADFINVTHKLGKRVIAVGTTVVRALETVTDTCGVTHAGEGWTDLLITPERGLHAVDALLTGLHEPRATHLYMLEALAGREHLQMTYQEALQQGYLWHEFGDLHLILP